MENKLSYEELEKENLRLKKRLKLLEKKLKRLRHREEKLLSEIDELDTSDENEYEIITPEKDEICPICNKRVETILIPNGIVKICEKYPKCTYRTRIKE